MADVTPTVKRTSIRAVQRNLGNLPKHFARKLPQRVERHGNKVYGRAVQESPVKTGLTRDSHDLSFSPQGLAYTVSVLRAPFRSAGLSYYPAFVHGGTSRQRANPWLQRVFREQEKVFQDEMRKATREAMATFRASK